MLGRNSAHIQQFVKRGVLNWLGEAERHKLARYFSIPKSVLGGPADAESMGGLAPVKRSPVRTPAGPGAIPYDQAGKPYFAFDEAWLKSPTASLSGGLSIIRVEATPWHRR